VDVTHILCGGWTRRAPTVKFHAQQHDTHGGALYAVLMKKKTKKRKKKKKIFTGAVRETEAVL